MRKQILWNSDWLFARGDTPEKATPVTLPHTWNAKDGQDGGNDYYRGTCLYTKAFAAPAHSDSEEVWLEFEGVAMTAVVTLNGQELDLTCSEFNILYHLAKRPGWVFTRNQIVNAIRGDDYPVTERAIDVQIVGLRRKMGAFGELIETVRGIGYRFSQEP